MSAPARTDRLSFIAYAVINKAAEPPELVKVELSRKAGREFIQWHEDADDLRIRRAEVKLFNT